MNFSQAEIKHEGGITGMLYNASDVREYIQSFKEFLEESNPGETFRVKEVPDDGAPFFFIEGNVPREKLQPVLMEKISVDPVARLYRIRTYNEGSQFEISVLYRYRAKP